MSFEKFKYSPTRVCVICKIKFKRFMSQIKEYGGKYCSKKCYGISKIGKSSWNKGIKTGYNKKQADKIKGRPSWNKEKHVPQYSGEKHWNWQGGKTPKLHSLRNSVEYANWREEVFIRDKFTCQMCKKHGCYLEAHHVKSFLHNPELRFDLNNGITLCTDCHCKVDKFRKRLKPKTLAVTKP